DFWGGVACRQLEDGTLQIAAGHHRVYAARAEGMTEADLFVSPRPVSDEEMARLYAQENATQRGVSTHALTGSVAAALSVVAMQVAQGDFSGNPEKSSDRSTESISGRFEANGEIGEPAISAFLRGILPSNQVRQALENLHTSGNYLRIREEVASALEADAARSNPQAMEARAAVASRARQAAVSAAEKTHTKMVVQDGKRVRVDTGQRVNARIFDYEGVSQFLTSASHIDTFRAMATRPGVQDILPMEQQAALARDIVERARLLSAEDLGNTHKGRNFLTSEFIKGRFGQLLASAQRTATEENRRQTENEMYFDRLLKAHVLQERFARSAYSLASACRQLNALYDEFPSGEDFPITIDCNTAYHQLDERVDKIAAREKARRRRGDEAWKPTLRLLS